MPRAIILSSLCALLLLALQGAAQTAPDQPLVTLRTTTDLVLIDVTATDGKKDPIQHLAPSDFTVFEDGHPQTLKAFEEHSVSASPVPLPPAPPPAPGTFTNFTPVPASGPLNILLIDKLNTPMAEQAVLREKVLKFLGSVPAGERMAIFVLTTRLSMLQGFTSDLAVLRAAIDKAEGAPKASPAMAHPVRGDSDGGSSLELEGLETELATEPGGAGFIGALVQLEQDFNSAKVQQSADYTLDALNALAHYLSGLQGRKNLIWLSGSFPISILPVPGARDPFSTTGVPTAEYRATVNLLARSQVAVYPIDVKGLSADNVWSANGPTTGWGAEMNGNPFVFSRNQQESEAKINDEHSSMNQMAAATGGRAFANSNDLSGAIATAVDSGANYYTLAYAPANRDWNGAYRKIEVKLARPGAQLAYRRGYYADDPSKPAPHEEEQNAAAGAAQFNPMWVAMQHGTPGATELIFQADVRPAADGAETSAAAGNQPGQDTTGPFRNYAVTFTAKVGDADCEAGPDSVRQCALVFVTYVYDADGALVNKQTNGVHVGIPGERYTAALSRNFVYRQDVSVPVKGEYFLRMGMRDDNNGGVGAVEAPVAAAEGLAPANSDTAPVGKLMVK